MRAVQLLPACCVFHRSELSTARQASNESGAYRMRIGAATLRGGLAAQTVLFAFLRAVAFAQFVNGAELLAAPLTIQERLWTEPLATNGFACLATELAFAVAPFKHHSTFDAGLSDYLVAPPL